MRTNLKWRIHKRSPKIGIRCHFESFVCQISEISISYCIISIRHPVQGDSSVRSFQGIHIKVISNDKISRVCFIKRYPSTPFVIL